MSTPTKEEWAAWRILPETKEFFRILAERRAEILQSWAMGHFTGPTSDETLQQNAQAIGEAQALDRIISPEVTEK